MANRYVYLVNKNNGYYDKKNIEFKWISGFSKSQKQKNITSLHEAFSKKMPQYNILEISSKSPIDIGVQASAFNLKVKTKKGHIFTVEELFQTSKVYEKAGKQSFLLEENLSIKEIKHKLREIDDNDKLIKFECFNQEFPLEPKTYFYNWLYINALSKNTVLANKIIEFDAFTDIEFNPKRSFNCQAEACSIFVSLVKSNKLQQALTSPKEFLNLVYS
ncbi:DUF6977 family protein [Staphylococcus sp. Marseille-Q1834]|uniref:DarT1-associated NADAR antitoxin family protein n=1 Tax=Staphylococcus sp. Marseille-Q1834 TaxID=2866594 RepID=UPI0012B772B2|nr:hypothetical protein [Staphylococcus sp. Marseille-Q1834]